MVVPALVGARVIRVSPESADIQDSVGFLVRIPVRQGLADSPVREAQEHRVFLGSRESEAVVSQALVVTQDFRASLAFPE